jgi:hypothetical protein
MSSQPRYTSPIPFYHQRIQAAAVYCSDGRFGEQFDDLLVGGLNLPRYDRLAVPGGAACLASHFQTYREEQAIAEQLRFLVDVHRLRQVILIAHENCAFYTERLRVSPLQLETKQRDDMRKAIDRVRAIRADILVEAWFARIVGNEVQFEQVPMR